MEVQGLVKFQQKTIDGAEQLSRWVELMQA